MSITLIFTSTFFNLSFFSDAAGFIVIPIEKFFCVSSNWFSQKINFFIDIFNAENENIALKRKVELYDLNSQRFKMLENENKKLTALLNIKRNYENYSLTAANVVAKDNGGWFNVFVIDKGLNDGLKNNMVVLSVNGLVGKIIECRNNFAKVSSIIDPKSSISIKNFRTGDLGFVKGDLKLKYDGLCSVEFLDSNAEIIEGDEIVTSHLSEIFPPGLLLGYVKKIDDSADENSIILEPVADLKHLDYVLVIIRELQESEDFFMEE